MSAPIQVGSLVKLAINIWLLSTFYVQLEGSADEADDFLMCRQCGHEITKADDLITQPSRLAMRQRNDTILGVKGVLIQLFENPQGSRFEVITSKKADVFAHEQAVSEHTWFPGFSWRIVFCPRCGNHLGWLFEPYPKEEKSGSKSTFTGLILGNLLHKHYADSLLITPKSYNS